MGTESVLCPVCRGVLPASGKDAYTTLRGRLIVTNGYCAGGCAERRTAEQEQRLAQQQARPEPQGQPQQQAQQQAQPTRPQPRVQAQPRREPSPAPVLAGPVPLRVVR